MKRYLPLVLAAVAACLAGAQFVPVDRTNPPVEADFDGAPEVAATLRRACYDCHSHETVWPWYARIAPMSWVVAHDVDEARRHVNFSRWGRLDPDKQGHIARECYEEASEGAMPPRMYRMAHRGAALGAADLAALAAWAGEGAVGDDPR